MGLKPLYLASGHAWQVSLDGRALRVEAAGRAPAWYPLRRLARIVSATDTQWQTNALMACLNAGVPVAFLDGHGQPVGYCYGHTRRETTLDGLLQLALDHPDWEQHFGYWRHAMERTLILRLQKVINVPLRRLDAEYVQGRFCNAHFQRLRHPVAPMFRCFTGPIHALAAARLSQLLSVTLLGHPRQGFCLTTELAELLHWPVHALVHRMAPPLPHDKTMQRIAVTLMEESTEVQQTLEELLSRFEHWLRGWVL